MSTPMDISELIPRVALRDRRAFDLLYQQTSAKLFGVALRVLRDRGEAEDALQEIYVRIWQNADRFVVGRASPMSWLITIARNHSIDRLRARRPAPSPIDDAAIEVRDPTPGAEARAAASGERARILGCLERLGTSQARAVRGAYLEGLSYQELADRLAIPMNTIRTWLRRGLIKLRECMEE